jgi:hypothetical protein
MTFVRSTVTVNVALGKGSIVHATLAPASFEAGRQVGVEESG